MFGSDEAILSLRMRDVDFPIVFFGNPGDVTDFSSARSRQRVGCCETPEHPRLIIVSDYNIYYDVVMRMEEGKTEDNNAILTTVQEEEREREEKEKKNVVCELLLYYLLFCVVVYVEKKNKYQKKINYFLYRTTR